MKWIKIKITTSQKGLTILEEIFNDAGIFTLEIEDSDEFLNILEKTKPSWDFVEESLYEEKSRASSVCAYIAENESSKNTFAQIQSAYEKLKEEDKKGIYSPLDLYFTVIDEEDWAENWKRYFKPLPVGENILICPVWEKIPDEYIERTTFLVDPGMSFGTGTHETTRLCLAMIERHQKKGAKTLDLGCGSGILAITSLLLGASYSVAVDIDENCVPIVRNNAEINNIEDDRYEVYCGNLLSDKKLIDTISKMQYDTVFMNIIPEVIIPLIPKAKELKKPDGKIIMSGIIGLYKDDVIKAAEACGIEIIDIIEENDWFCVVGG